MVRGLSYQNQVLQLTKKQLKHHGDREVGESTEDDEMVPGDEAHPLQKPAQEGPSLQYGAGEAIGPRLCQRPGTSILGRQQLQ